MVLTGFALETVVGVGPAFTVLVPRGETVFGGVLETGQLHIEAVLALAVETGCGQDGPIRGPRVKLY
jgi:hypothetical protein